MCDSHTIGAMRKSPVNRLNPAWSVACACEVLGGDGAKVLADLAGVHRTTVYAWFRPVSAGGTGGLIPASRQRKILTEAQKRQIPLTAYDIIFGVRPDEQH